MLLLAHVLDWPRSTSAKPTSSLLYPSNDSPLFLRESRKSLIAPHYPVWSDSSLRSWIPLFTIGPFLLSFLLQWLYQMLQILRCCQSCTSRILEWVALHEWMTDEIQVEMKGRLMMKLFQKLFPCYYGMRCHGTCLVPISAHGGIKTTE